MTEARRTSLRLVLRQRQNCPSPLWHNGRERSGRNLTQQHSTPVATTQYTHCYNTAPPIATTQHHPLQQHSTPFATTQHTHCNNTAPPIATTQHTLCNNTKHPLQQHSTPIAATQHHPLQQHSTPIATTQHTYCNNTAPPTATTQHTHCNTNVNLTIQFSPSCSHTVSDSRLPDPHRKTQFSNASHHLSRFISNTASQSLITPVSARLQPISCERIEEVSRWMRHALRSYTRQ